MTFEKLKLKDFAKVNMGQSPKSKYYNTEKKGVPFLQGVKTFGDIYPKIDTYTEKTTKIAEKGEILFSVRAPVGNVNIAPFELCIGRGLASISGENNIFLYYLLKSYGNIYESYSTGTVFSSINKKTLENLEFNLPSNSVQTKIANILSAFDDKIDNNNKIINNLEEQAQAIFKSWFVDFEPFQDEEFVESELGVIPKGWEVTTIKEIAQNIVTGKTPSTKEPLNYGEEVPFITIPDMHNNVYTVETERYLSEKGISTQHNKTLPKNAIVVSCIATVGLVSLVSEESQTNQQINAIIAKDNISPYYLYNYLKTQYDYLNAIGSSGSATKNVNKKTFSNLKILYPYQEILSKYHKICKPIFEYILLP